MTYVSASHEQYLVALARARAGSAAVTPVDVPIDHILTPDMTSALQAAEDTSADVVRRDSATPDRLADTDRCAGCFTVTPTARAYHIPGVGFGCVDCNDL